MPGCPCCRYQGESPEIIAFPGSEPFGVMRFLVPPRQWFLKLTLLKTELWVYGVPTEAQHCSRRLVQKGVCVCVWRD
jgi:hypothetical protein